MNKSLVLAAAVAVVSPVASVLAAPVLWGPVQDLTSSAVVYDLAGNATQVFGWNSNNADTNVDTGNGLPFAAQLHSWKDANQSTSGSGSNAYGVPYLDLAFAPLPNVNTGLFVASTPSGWNADLVTMMAGATWLADPFGMPPMTATLSNLQIGQTYIAQFFVADARGGINRTQTITSAGNTSGTMTYGADAPFFATAVTGTFTADAPSQAFTFDDPTSVQVNAIMVTAVPEPATLGLVGAGGLVGAIAIRRRRTSRVASDG
jgi:hypothetical protein